MKKILLATSALVASTGFAAADVSSGIDISGSAQMGFEYAESSTPGVDEVTANTEFALEIAMSGETDGGLAFGATTNYLVEHQGTPTNDDTWVWVSGAFGKLSMGDVAEADQVAGLSDLGLDGLGTDNAAEILSGDDTTGKKHDINYTYTGGALTLGLSANLGEGNATFDNESFAVGVKYDFGDFYLGAGYADHSDLDDGGDPPLAGVADYNATSVFAGGTVANLKIAAMYTMADGTVGGTLDPAAFGVTVAYTTGATTISAAYSDNDLANTLDPSYGIGVSYDLGGGASLVGAVGSIDDAKTAGGAINKADFGVKMSF